VAVSWLDAAVTDEVPGAARQRSFGGGCADTGSGKTVGVGSERRGTGLRLAEEEPGTHPAGCVLSMWKSSCGQAGGVVLKGNCSASSTGGRGRRRRGRRGMGRLGGARGVEIRAAHGQRQQVDAKVLSAAQH
jgi:hypothetical protein